MLNSRRDKKRKTEEESPPLAVAGSWAAMMPKVEVLMLKCLIWTWLNFILALLQSENGSHFPVPFRHSLGAKKQLFLGLRKYFDRSLYIIWKPVDNWTYKLPYVSIFQTSLNLVHVVRKRLRLFSFYVVVLWRQGADKISSWNAQGHRRDPQP